MEGVGAPGPVDLAWTPTPGESSRIRRDGRRALTSGGVVVALVTGILGVTAALLVGVDRVVVAIGAGTLIALGSPVAVAVVHWGRRHLFAGPARPVRLRLDGQELEIVRGGARTRIPLDAVPPPRREGDVVVLDLDEAVVIPVARVDPEGLDRLLAALSAFPGPTHRPVPKPTRPMGTDPFAPPGT